jgi:predicted glycogen debranching enzyme
MRGVTVRYSVEGAGVTRGGGRGDAEKSGRGAVRLRLVLRPLAAMRDFHGLLREGGGGVRLAVPEKTAGNADTGARGRGDAGVRVGSEGAALTLALGNEASAGVKSKFRRDEQWWRGFFYPREAERGQDCVEDLFSPGEFVWEMGKGMSRGAVTLNAAVDGEACDVSREEERQKSRLERLVRWTVGRAAKGGEVQEGIKAGGIEASRRVAIAALVVAGDGYVARLRGTRATVIAGYPWFGDWGRDTMIALPGLLLATGRHEEALETLRSFAAARRRGIIPNRFDDDTGEAQYNTVDASLWFIQAACSYVEATKDVEGSGRELLPACLDLIEHYRRGTDYGIVMDPSDCLITGGSPSTQLTWMDAARDGVVFTPRWGKAVEVNALWVSGLLRLAEALDRRGRTQEQGGAGSRSLGAELRALGAAAGKSLAREFWWGGGGGVGCLYDRLEPRGGGCAEASEGVKTWRGVEEIRPNQILAASLPGVRDNLSMEQKRAVVRVVGERLLTDRGLRTLDPADPRYRGRFEGSMFDRDAAYHNGTVWPWLVGAWVDAAATVGSGQWRKRSTSLLAELVETMGVEEACREGGCLGQIAEVFDGDEPRRPGGCLAQAWSVGELMRALARG